MEVKTSFPFIKSVPSTEPEKQAPLIVTPKPSNKKEHPKETPLILEEIVIEEISIDGMCGVY